MNHTEITAWFTPMVWTNQSVRFANFLTTTMTVLLTAYCTAWLWVECLQVHTLGTWATVYSLYDNMDQTYKSIH